MVDLKVRVTGDSRDVQTAFVQAGSSAKTFSATAQAAVAEVEARIKRMADKTSGMNLIGTGGTQAVAATTAASLGRMEAAAVRLKAQIDPLAAAQMKLTSQLAEFDMMAQHGMLTTGQLTQAQGLARAEFHRSSEELKQHGNALAFNRNQVAMFTHSAKSLGEGLVSGQNISTMVMQQGLELADALEMGEGGITGSLTAIGTKLASVFTPGRLLIGGMTAAALGLSYAFVRVHGAIEDTDKSLETGKKLMEGVRSAYITNLPEKEAPPPPSKIAISNNIDDVKIHEADSRAYLQAYADTLRAQPYKYGSSTGKIADALEKYDRDGNSEAANQSLFSVRQDNPRLKDEMTELERLITEHRNLAKQLGESGSALSTMSDATKKVSSNLLEVSDAMSRLRGSIPDLSAKLSYFGKIADINAAAKAESVDKSRDERASIGNTKAAALRANDENFANGNWVSGLREDPNRPQSSVDNLNQQLGKSVGASLLELQRLSPGGVTPKLLSGAQRFDEHADAYRKDPTLARPGASLAEKGAEVTLDMKGISQSDQALLDKLMAARGLVNPDGKSGHYVLKSAADEQHSEQFKAAFDMVDGAQSSARVTDARTSNLSLHGSQRAAADLAAQKTEELRRQNVPIDTTAEAQIRLASAAEASAQSNFNYAELLKNSRMRIQSMDLERGGYALTAEAQAKLKIQTELYNEAERQNIDLTPAHKAAINDLADAYAKSETSLKKAAEAQAGLNQAWSGVQGLSTTFIDGMIDHTLNLRSALKAAIPVVLQLFNAMGKMQSTTGSFGINFGNPFGAPLGGAVSTGGGILSTLFGGLFGGGSSTGLAAAHAAAEVRHAGGFVGDGRAPSRMISMLPRYHTGFGIKPDEKLAVLQDGELVVPQKNLVDPMLHANVSPFGSQGAAANVMSMVRGGDTFNVNGDPDRRTMNTLRTMLDQRSQTDARETARNIGTLQGKWKQNRG